MIGQGRLYLGKWYAYDGVNFFNILSPYLIHKIHRHHGKIVIFISGTWVTVGDWIIWFKRNKKDIAHYTDLKQPYTRELILECSS